MGSELLTPVDYLRQYFQALVDSQSISQCSGSRISNTIQFKTVEESTSKLVQGEYIIYRVMDINGSIFFSYVTINKIVALLLCTLMCEY